MRPRRPFRALAYAALLLAAAAYIVFSASRQPAFINGTFVGTATAGLFGKARSTGMGGPLRFYHKKGEVWIPMDWTGNPASSPSFVTWWPSRSPIRSGLWHPVLETKVDSLVIRDQRGQEVDASTRRDILRGISASDPGLVPIEKLEYYAAGGGSTRRILWLGVLGDLSILAAFAAILFSAVRLRREFKLRKPGHCPRCNYSLAGLNAAICPECGHAPV